MAFVIETVYATIVNQLWGLSRSVGLYSHKQLNQSGHNATKYILIQICGSSLHSQERGRDARETFNAYMGI